jgi:transcriptional regulator with XRE-family HTH domain
MDTNDTTPAPVHRRPGRSVPLDTDKLREVIDTSGLSLREVARRSGVTAAHLDGVLLGKHGISPRSLRQITAELQVPYESVLR